MASVSIVAMGKTKHEFMNDYVLYSRKRLTDHVWAMNGMIPVIRCNMGFMMDDTDIVIPEILETLEEPWKTKTFNMVEAVKDIDVPIVVPYETKLLHRPFVYPLHDVVATLGHARLFNTTAYAIAYAIHMHYDEIRVYGVDFGYSDDGRLVDLRTAMDIMNERACVEALLQQAEDRGINVYIPNGSALRSMNTNTEHGLPLYGYGKGARAKYYDERTKTLKEIESLQGQ